MEVKQMKGRLSQVLVFPINELFYFLIATFPYNAKVLLGQLR